MGPEVSFGQLRGHFRAGGAGLLHPFGPSHPERGAHHPQSRGRGADPGRHLYLLPRGGSEGGKPLLRYALFDLDETLYPKDSGLMREIRRRMSLFMEERLGLEPELISRLRRQYYQRYGTTMRGLMIHHGVAPEEFLAYVHDIPLEEYLGPDGALDAVLGKIELEKVIFTNASAEHARRVLGILGVERHFGRIIDVRTLDYVAKPDPLAYRRALDILGAEGRECLIVDDSLRNLAPAKELGMVTVLVGGEPGEGADFAIAQVTEIGRIVRHLLGGENG
ncbi:MAG TPA: pyrimidine 5'-nucleotidase [Anaerolineae bacterium]|nr:pyrimidine 5'-nucleotidase [Anaerolineae bacterium]